MPELNSNEWKEEFLERGLEFERRVVSIVDKILDSNLSFETQQRLYALVEETRRRYEESNLSILERQEKLEVYEKTRVQEIEGWNKVIEMLSELQKKYERGQYDEQA